LAFPAGHIGIYVSSRAQQEIPTAVAQWLHERGK
jgi:polyhydroxyalkanoate synthase